METQSVGFELPTDLSRCDTLRAHIAIFCLQRLSQGRLDIHRRLTQLPAVFLVELLDVVAASRHNRNGQATTVNHTDYLRGRLRSAGDRGLSMSVTAQASGSQRP